LLDAAVGDALGRVVPLPGGQGRLVFDQTEARIAIDSDGTLAAEQLIEAAFAEIPTQLRLRGLAGIIVIDPPRIPRARMHSFVESLSAAFSTDPVETHVHGLTRAGLVEITRSRVRPSLADIIEGDPLMTEGLKAVQGAVMDALASRRGTVTLNLPPPIAQRLRAEPAVLVEAWERFGVALTLQEA